MYNTVKIGLSLPFHTW